MFALVLRALRGFGRGRRSPQVTRAARIRAFGVAGLALASAIGASGCSDGATRRNVVLISIDSLRADRLGCYGHVPEFAPDQALSPHIDELAKRGVVFDSAWTSSSWTLPAHMSLLTGLGAAAHGVETDDVALDPLRETLAERFRAAGWSTAGVYSGPYLHPRWGFARGFERYESAMLTPAQVDELVARESARRVAKGEPAVGAEEERLFRSRISNWDVTSSRVTGFAERFLETRDAEEPFFLFLHYFDVHYDHVPDDAVPGLAHAFDPSYAGPFDGRNWYFDARVRELEPPFTRRIGERDLRHVMALYDAEVQWVDHHVGRVLAELEKRGLTDDTIIVVVSDHGDEFFEHDGIGHRNTLFAEVERIPLVLALPDGTHAGRRSATPVRIQDVAPTLLDYSGASASTSPDARVAPGRIGSAASAIDAASLRGLLDGTETSARVATSRLYDPAPWFLNLREAWRDSRFSVVRHFVVEPGAVEARVVERGAARPGALTPGAVTRGAVAQVRDVASGEPIFHVFDRADDPGERAALRPDDPRYRDAVERFRRSWTAERAFLDQLEHSPREACRVMEADPQQRAQLAALGYASGVERDTAAPVRERLVLPPP
ncbi:MAG: sulfatase [Planctomycetes bacterium]|nr:sulfatase [Planctomycetota bacterium]